MRRKRLTPNGPSRVNVPVHIPEVNPQDDQPLRIQLKHYSYRSFWGPTFSDHNQGVSQAF